MPVFRYFAFVGTSLLVLLLLSDACFGPGEADSMLNPPAQASAIEALPGPNSFPTERWYPANMTPAARIKEVFAQFVPGESKRLKRYSSAGQANPT